MAEPPRKRLPLRWLSLAEIVGIAALAIAGLTFWDSHRERTQTDAQRAAAAREQKAESAAQAKAGALKLSFLMIGTPEADGERLHVNSVHSEQVIQTQAISFPGELRGDAVQTTGNPRVEAKWFEGGLAKALHKRGDKQTQGRIPMGMVTVFIEDGQTKTDRALYLVGYNRVSRVLRPDRIELEGLSLVRRGVGEDLQEAVDAAWARSAP